MDKDTKHFLPQVRALHEGPQRLPTAALAHAQRKQQLQGGFVQRVTPLAFACEVGGVTPLVRARDVRLRGRFWRVVLTTHYMEEAERLCDYVVIMTRGRVVCQGSPRELIDTRIGREVFEVDCTPEEETRLLEALEGLGRMRSGARLHAYGQGTEMLVKRLQAFAPKRPFIVRPANLEDVFLAETGTRLEEGV